MTASSKSRDSWSWTVLRVCGSITGLGIVVVMIGTLFRQRAGLPWPTFAMGVAGLALLVLHYLAVIEAWRGIMADLGVRIPRQSAYGSWILSSLGVYLPGKVWPYFARIALVPGDKVAVGASLILETAFNLATGVIWIGLVCVAIGISFPLSEILLPGFAALLVIGCVVFARNRLKPAIETVSAVHFSAIRVIVFRTPYFLLSWFFYGCGHSLILSRLSSPDLKPFVLTGMLAIGWLAGALAVIFPAGIGASDWTIAHLLSSHLSSTDAVGAALLVRFFNLLSHAVLLIALPFLRSTSKRHS